MYVPSAFNESRPEVLHALMRKHSFATLVAHTDAGIVASHVPLLLDEQRGPRGTLSGHLAVQNPQWRAFEQRPEVLAIFHGPHAYVSPKWYVNPAVPTWNYAVVHAYGIPRLLDGPALRAQLEKLVETYESSHSEPWGLRQLSPDFIDRMQRAVVGFDIEITRLEGKWKLSQNRPSEDRCKAIEALSQSDDPVAVAVAELMAARLEPP